MGHDIDIESALDQNDSRRALSLLHERYAAKLTRSLTPICGQDAKDIVQKCFEQAQRDLGTFKREVPARVWIGRIAHNRAMDHLRSAIRSRALFAPLADDLDIESPERTADVDLDVQERVRLVGKALAQMKPEVSFAIVLRHVEGFSFPEMEEFCHAKPPALERRVARGMKELRDRLKKIEHANRAEEGATR